MATHYSEHYTIPVSSATVAPQTSLPLAHRRAPTGTAGMPIKRTRVYMDFGAGTLLASGDTLRMFTFRSNDRITDLRLTTEASTWTTGGTLTMDLGLYLVGRAHDGAALDSDIFVEDIDMTGALARTEALTNGDLTNPDRSLMLWEMAALGDGTDTVDPLLDYDIVGTFTAGPATAQGILMLECEWVPGGRN